VRNFSRKRLVFLLLTALFSFLVLVSLVISRQQRDVLRANTLRDVHTELQLMADASLEPLLKSDYVAVRNFVSKWGAGRSEYHDLRVTAPNGFTIARYANSETPVGETYTLSKEISLDGERLAVITLSGDYCQADILMANVRNKFILAALLLTAALGAALWIIFRSAALDPLEDAVRARTRDLLAANRELEQLTNNSPA
jgi:hypothetical protein